LRAAFFFLFGLPSSLFGLLSLQSSSKSRCLSVRRLFRDERLVTVQGTCGCLQGDLGEEVELGMTEQNEDNVAVSF
jgi:hypothetical protein